MSESTPAARMFGMSATTRWMIFAALLVWGAPQLAWQVQYAWTRSRLEAEWDHARVKTAAVGFQPQQHFRLVAQAASPSVVRIKMLAADVREGAEPNEVDAVPEGEGGLGAPPSAPDRNALPDRLAAPPKSRSPLLRRPKAVVPPRTSLDEDGVVGEGSGVVVSADGYILTNQHVVLQGDEIWTKFQDGRVLRATMVGADPLTDLALLKVEAKDLHPAQWGDSEQLQVGDWVLALGAPFGLEQTVTAGIVSAKGRHNLRSGQTYQDYLQTDAAVNPGNSGGPLMNMQGEVVGINTMILGSRYQGISFAIPSAIARLVGDRLRLEGRVPRGWLGVSLEEVHSESADDPSQLASRVRIRSVQHEGPAERAGAAAQDVVVGWNGVEVKTLADLRWKIATTEVGSTAVMAVLRRDERLEFKVEIAERPEQP